MPTSSRDGQLVMETLNGDRNAFAELVRAHQGRALATARALCGDFDTAQDVTQEAFVQAYLSLRKLRDPAAFGAWLYGIVRNLSRKRTSRGRPAPVSLERDDVPEPSTGPPEVAGEMVAALAGLPRHHREILAARYLQDLDYPEIARALGTTVNNVRVRCFRAKKALREALAAAGGQVNG